MQIVSDLPEAPAAERQSRSALFLMFMGTAAIEALLIFMYLSTGGVWTNRYTDDYAIGELAGMIYSVSFSFSQLMLMLLAVEQRRSPAAMLVYTTPALVFPLSLLIYTSYGWTVNDLISADSAPVAAAKSAEVITALLLAAYVIYYTTRITRGLWALNDRASSYNPEQTNTARQHVQVGLSHLALPVLISASCAFLAWTFAPQQSVPLKAASLVGLGVGMLFCLYNHLGDPAQNSPLRFTSSRDTLLGPLPERARYERIN